MVDFESLPIVGKASYLGQSYEALFGTKQKRKVHLKLARNVAFFVGGVFAITNWGQMLLVPDEVPQ